MFNPMKLKRHLVNAVWPGSGSTCLGSWITTGAAVLGMGGCANPAMNASLTPAQVASAINSNKPVVAIYQGGEVNSSVLGVDNLEKIAQPLVVACKRAGGRPEAINSNTDFSPGHGEIGRFFRTVLATRVTCQSAESHRDPLWSAEIDYRDYKMGNNTYLAGNLTVTVKAVVTYHDAEEAARLQWKAAERLATAAAMRQNDQEQRVKYAEEQMQRAKAIEASAKVFRERIKFGDQASYTPTNNRVRVVEVKLPLVLVQFDDASSAATPNKWVDVSLLKPLQ
jgi:hypothetical protein